MFEKEAIIHAFEATIGIECLNKPIEDFTYEELSDEQQEKAYDFKKGAEFGYNKAFVEADKNLKAIVADFNKAKEIIKEMLSILPKENIGGIYEITEEAEQFIREVEE